MWKFYSADWRGRWPSRVRISGQNSSHRFPARRPSRPFALRSAVCPGVVMLGGSQAFSMTLLKTLPANSAPRRLELTVGTRREHHGLQRVRRSRPGAAARRADVSGILSPQSAESGFDGVGDGDVSLAFEIPLAEAKRRSRPLVRDAPARLPCRRDGTDGEAARAEHAFDDPVDALDAVDGCRRLFGVGRWNADGLRIDGPTHRPIRNPQSQESRSRGASPGS